MTARVVTGLVVEVIASTDHAAMRRRRFRHRHHLHWDSRAGVQLRVDELLQVVRNRRFVVDVFQGRVGELFRRRHSRNHTFFAQLVVHKPITALPSDVAVDHRLLDRHVEYFAVFAIQTS